MPPPPPWRTELAQSLREPAALLAALGLSAGQFGGERIAPPPPGQSPGTPSPQTHRNTFPFRVPRGYVARMQRADLRDPLLRQVLPTAEEDTESPGYSDDPLAEGAARRVPGVLQKYRGRVLLITTAACAIHCRYCFRRHFAYGESGLSGRGLNTALAWIGREQSIREVILSGGDPLCLDDGRLAELTERIARIPHVRYLRVHTRLPIVLPTRVCGPLVSWLTGTRLRPVVVVHANHPNEIDGQVKAALARLRGEGITLLNQSVLLRGVNDDADTLANLSERLFAAGALPYYLHLLDPVTGAQHFAVSAQRASQIMAELRARLPGYLVPRPVREVAGAEYKIPLA
uniref:L-lysine 2,3-aminomutase n=1 Tax=Candidatus Kentrum sp. DK TaxID=2126562 RepID=A0A450S8J6_9GAMM|nr:MAG: L-lysine 2,3-aminomutase [Candidatus Kentron sp. DK]